jgi:uncharacterized protein YciI
MPLYAVEYTYSDDASARDEHRRAHREFLGSLAREGTVRLSGPVEGEPAAALIVIEGDSVESVRQLLGEDPFQQQGLVTAVTVRAWTPVLGAWLP